MTDLPTTSEILLRVAAATLAGALVGMERETHGRAAGLRTTILAGVASALAMIASECLFIQAGNGMPAGASWRPDPARLGAGILTGIGFLGAGTILRHDDMIRGVTTAACLWFVTVLGLAFGSGLFGLGTIGLAIGMATLFLLPPLEKHVPSDWYSTLTVTMELNALDELQLVKRVNALGLKVRRTELDYDLAGKKKTITCDLKLERNKEINVSSRV